MSISLTQNNISPGHFMNSGNPEQKKYDRDNKSWHFIFINFINWWYFFISIFHSSSIRDCLLKEKQYFTQRLHKPKKLPVPWLFHVKIINRILRSSTFLSTQGTSSPSDWLEHFLLCIAGCCFLMPINATCCYKNVFKKKNVLKKKF